MPLVVGVPGAWGTHSHAALVEGEAHSLNFRIQCRTRIVYRPFVITSLKGRFVIFSLKL